MPPTSTRSHVTVNGTVPDSAASRHIAEPLHWRAALPACCAAVVLVVGSLGSPAWAQSTPRPIIYTCIDANGKKLTSDRPIAECNNRDQRVLNGDGSPNRIVPPTPTADERAAQEQRDRDAAAERAARNDAIRRDRNLLSRFPDEATHRKARAKALDDIGASVRVSEARISLLKVERKPLLDEAEFYVGKSLPSKVKTALDANDAALDAQKELMQSQQSEIVRINGLFDAELARLKKLWAGSAAGSLGPIVPPTPAPVQKDALK